MGLGLKLEPSKAIDVTAGAATPGSEFIQPVADAWLVDGGSTAMGNVTCVTRYSLFPVEWPVPLTLSH